MEELPTVSTRVLTVSSTAPDPGAVEEAARVLREGGIVCLPTETVYGLAARLDDAGAMHRLRQLKGRSHEEPFPVQIAEKAAVSELVTQLPLNAKPLIKHYWPGPLTIVFPSASVNAGGRGIGVRVPAHIVSQAVLRELGGPAAVPSCNPRGAPPAVAGADVLRYFADRVDLVLDCGPTPIQEASAVVRVGEGGWELLREGLISREMISRLIDGRTYLFVCTGNTCRSPMAYVLAEELFAAHAGLIPSEVGHLGFRFLSAGTDTASGRPASRNARIVMAEVGLSLGHHRTRRLSATLLHQADVIVCMDAENRACVGSLAPDVDAEVRLLSPDEIEDPAGGSVEEYRQTRDAIREALKALWC